MSHGPSSGGVKAEPNLTPMLDVVMNLLVFFILGFRLFTEQVDQRLELPSSQSARPLDQSEGEALFLNLTYENKVKVVEGTNLEEQSLGQVKRWLQDKYDAAKRLSKDGEVNIVIIVRADKRADYANVFKLMRVCKEVGFRKLRVRADIP